jgi:hypothetical protein
MFALDDVAFLGSLSTYDPDALAYIRAVEIADTQELEPGVRTAINDFVLGCKTDNTWSALKAACILAGARTLAGALVPLVGAAPTNFNFGAGDYNRETGLLGNGSTKYLDSGRNNNADSQDNQHMSLFPTTINSGTRWYMGAGVSDSGATQIFSQLNGVPSYRNRNSTSTNSVTALASAGFIGMSRNNSANFNERNAGVTSNITRASQSPFAGNVFVFLSNGSTTVHSNARLAFYSIGESLDLALLDARVTTLINAIAAAIP